MQLSRAKPGNPASSTSYNTVRRHTKEKDHDSWNHEQYISYLIIVEVLAVAMISLLAGVGLSPRPSPCLVIRLFPGVRLFARRARRLLKIRRRGPERERRTGGLLAIEIYISQETCNQQRQYSVYIYFYRNAHIYQINTNTTSGVPYKINIVLCKVLHQYHDHVIMIQQIDYSIIIVSFLNMFLVMIFILQFYSDLKMMKLLQKIKGYDNFKHLGAKLKS